MKKVLCIGSVTTDVLVTPVDSVPTAGTLRAVDGISMHVGGCAANCAIDLAKLGVPAALSCKVGADSFGAFVRSTAESEGVDIRGVVVDETVATTASVGCIASSGERSFLYNPASTSAFVKEDVSPALLAESDIVFVAGAFLLTRFDGEPCAQLLREARRQGKFTAMDTAWDFEDKWLPKIAAALPELDLFMPSYDEAAKITGESDPDRIADRLFDAGVKSVVIKLGKDGALICENRNSRQKLPTYSAFKPVDTTGAGDSFCAGFLTGLAQGWSYVESGRLANVVGTHCILAVGASTGIPTLAQAVAFLQTHTAG